MPKGSYVKKQTRAKRRKPDNSALMLQQLRVPINTPLYSTKNGSLFCGKSDELLARDEFEKFKGKVQLIFTSPPFPLNTKKEYGNLTGPAYIKWLSEFAPLMKKLLTPNGSIVVEIGNAWQRGEPVMSTTVLRALLKFLDKGGFHLCQEFVWYNPARLPSPIQWVNVERSRVKEEPVPEICTGR